MTAHRPRCDGTHCGCFRAEPSEADVLHHIVPTPRPPADCDCEACDDQRHLEAERQTWRDIDDARRTAAELRQQGEGR